MVNPIKYFFSTIFSIEKDDRLKVILLSAAFFFVIGSYTIARELKDSLFVHIVGRTYIPLAKIIGMIILIPAILLYSKLVDSMRKHQLVYAYMAAYGLIGLIIAYFIGHQSIGLANTVADKHRYFGWFLYFFYEGYPPFIASLFWAFANSITSPEGAKTGYPVMVAVSKVGGIVGAGIALMLLARNSSTNAMMFSDIANHQILMVIASLFLLFVPLCIYLLIKKVPSKNLHGYEAAYRADRQGLTGLDNEGFFTRLFSGLILLVRYPYVLGMFGMIFFWEIVNTFFGYERLGVGKMVALNVSDYTRFLFQGIIFSHIVGLIIVLFGTRLIIRWLGERKSLILVPVLTGVSLIFYMQARSPWMVNAIFVLLRALNYAFASPLRESLYIPTTKDMRFKSKSWIDAFGAKFAKASGSSYNVVTQILPSAMVETVHTGFFTVIIGGWLLTAHLLGRRFERAVARNEVIGIGKV